MITGEYNVDDMLSHMSSTQFDEWRAFLMIYPVGADATFLAAAQVVAAILNTNRKKGARAIRTKEIVPDFLAAAKRAIDRISGKTQAQVPAQTMQDQIIIVEMLNTRFGGRDLRKSKHGK